MKSPRTVVDEKICITRTTLILARKVSLLHLPAFDETNSSLKPKAFSFGILTDILDISKKACIIIITFRAPVMDNMKLVYNLIFAAMLIQVSIPNAACQNENEDPWLRDTMGALGNLEEISNLKSVICPDDAGLLDCITTKLTEYLHYFENFLTKARLNEKVYNKKLAGIFNALRGFTEGSPPSTIEEYFLTSSSLRGKYDSVFRPLMVALKNDVGEAFGTDPLASNGYVLPLQTACSNFLDRDLPTLSVKDVCPTTSRCSTSVHSSTTNACGQNNVCDINKAIPLMVGVLFYKVSFAFVDRFCSEGCTEDGGCNFEEEYASIAKQVELMKAFIRMHPENQFDQFFRDAVTRRAYSQIGAAMEIISENEQNFNLPFSSFACEEIEAIPGCQVARFYPEYLLLKKMKEKRLDPGHTGDTRDLTLYENVDHAKIIELKKEVIKHNELLSAIDQLNENLETQVRGIASYFKGIASFDQGIANADVLFIQDKLQTYNEEYTKLEAKVNKDVRDAMTAMKVVLAAQLVEETIALVAKIMAESNPIKAIFSGVDTEGVREQAVTVADAAAQLGHGLSLFAHLKSLATDTREIGTDLHNNQEQIKSMTSLVDKIKNNQLSDIGDDAETFITQYSGYTPQVDKHRMAQNIAKWGAFKESTCNLLNGVEGIGASVGKGVANGFLLCENLEATLAEYDALRENIFDFQFELVDSLARVVRGNVGQKLADSIQGQENDIFKADQLLGGFLMTQNFIQSQSWLYCDKLEYKNGGERAQPCSPETGLFTNSDLDNLVAFTDHQTYISIERTVYIPSKPQYRGDLGFINIHAFARDKTASFRLPQDVNWLYKFDWSLIGESHAPYVENFQLFLPKKEYTTCSEKLKTSTRIVVTADTEAGSYVSADRQSSVLYKLPERQTSFVTVYQEGYRSSTCPKEIPNPYSLCNNLPNICHTSNNVAGDSLLPTTLSRWRVTYSVQSGEQEVDWVAPTDSTTNLNLIAKLTLRMLPPKSSRNRRSAIKRADEHPEECCQGNTYRSSLVNSVCTDCPSGSTTMLGGYYCEANPIPPETPTEPQGSPPAASLTGDKTKQHFVPHVDRHRRRHKSVTSPHSLLKSKP